MTVRRFWVYAAAAALLMEGCAVGPDFVRPAAPMVSSYTPMALPAQTVSAPVMGGEAQRFLQDADVPADWWTIFHSNALDALMARALHNNPNLDAAQAALRAARENVRAQRGAFYPSVTGAFSASRQQVADTIASPAFSGATLVNLFDAQIGVTYVLDVFGGVRRQVEAARAEAESQRFLFEAVYLTLTTNVAAAAVEEASLRGQIAATQHMIEIQGASLDLLRRARMLGQISEAEVAAQEAALALVQQTLPGLEKQLGQQRDLLAVLSGYFPNDEPAETFEFSTLRLPMDLPVIIPSKLVEQRPDIRAGEENLHVASAQIGVAIANRLPNITLGAAAGSSSTEIADLFQPGAAFWALGASIAQPIFDGGTLAAKERAARALYEQAQAQYRGILLTAFQNVADTLRALQQDAEALRAAAAAESAAAHSLDIVQRQLRLGQVSYLALLNAQQTYAQAQLNLIQSQTSRFSDTIALFQALGGGWWNRSDVQSAQTAAQERMSP